MYEAKGLLAVNVESMAKKIFEECWNCPRRRGQCHQIGNFLFCGYAQAHQSQAGLDLIGADVAGRGSVKNGVTQ